MASDRVCPGCGQVHRPGLLVELVGGPRDGQRHDYSLGDPAPLPDGVYVLDRRWGEDHGKRREYVYQWHPTTPTRPEEGAERC